MKRLAETGISSLTAILCLSLVQGDAIPGQFKTLETAALKAKQQISARSSPKNTPAGAMELEIYEWQSAAGDGIYQCRILRNATGQPLNIRLVGVDATIVDSCSAPDGGSCSTLPAGLLGGLKFQCVVATQCCGFPVTPNAHYRMAVRLLELLGAARSAHTAPSPSGVITSSQ